MFTSLAYWGIAQMFVISSSKEQSCQERLANVASLLDKSPSGKRAKELYQMLDKTVPVECRDSGHWWLLSGWAQYQGGDRNAAQQRWAVAQDLYVDDLEGAQQMTDTSSGPILSQPGRLETIVRSTLSDTYAFQGMFGFPVYKRIHQFQDKSVKHIHHLLSKADHTHISTVPVESSELQALISKAVAEFASQSLVETASKELRKLVKGYQTAVSVTRASAGFHGFQALLESIDSEPTGPHLRGIFVVNPLDSVSLCLTSPRPDRIRAWIHGHAGERIELHIPASNGTLLLFHRSLRPRLCISTTEIKSRRLLWIMFNAWVRSPVTEDAGEQEGGLRFLAPKDYSKADRGLIKHAGTVGSINLIWQWPIEVVRFHYHWDLRQKLQHLSSGLQATTSKEDDLLDCPYRYSNILGATQVSGMRAALLSASASFLSKHLQRVVEVSHLKEEFSALCNISHRNPNQRLVSKPGTSSILRGIYIASPNMSSPDPSRPMPLKVEVASETDLGVHSEGFVTAINWPFAITPKTLSARLPSGALLFLPSNARVTINQYSGEPHTSGSVLVFDLSLAKVQGDFGVSESSVSDEQMCAVKDHPDQFSQASLMKEKENVQGEESVAQLFPTSIHVRQLSSVKKLNSEVKKAVLSAAKEKATASLSNVGGWQSEADWLMSAPHQCLRDLQTEFADAILMALSQEIPPDVVVDLDLRITGWANMNKLGNSNGLHHHSDLDWRLSGVYVVDTGGGDDNSTVQFRDPRPLNAFGKLWRSLDPWPLAGVKARPGLMFLFPSWLEHYVQPHTGSRSRITIAINVAAYWKKNQAKDLVDTWTKGWAQGRTGATGKNMKQQQFDVYSSILHTRWTTMTQSYAKNVTSSVADSATKDANLESLLDKVVCSHEQKSQAESLCDGINDRVRDVQRLCMLVLSGASSVLCETAKGDCNVSSNIGMMAVGRGISESIVVNESLIMPLASSRHQLDALLWGVVVLGGSDSSNEHAALHVTARILDPRPVGRNFEHLHKARQRQQALQEIPLRIGSIIVIPPWLKSEVISLRDSRGPPNSFRILAFDVYPIRG